MINAVQRLVPGHVVILDRMRPRLQPTADAGLVSRILAAEGAIEKPFFPWDHDHRDDADCWHEGYKQPNVIQKCRQREIPGRTARRAVLRTL